MLYKFPQRPRRGTSIIEGAIVYPVTFFLIFGLLIGGMGIFRYQEVAHLARECARFASTHGGQYAKENAAAITAGTTPSVDEAYLKTLVKSGSVSLKSNNLTVTVNINTTGGSYDWDDTGNTNNRWPSSTTVVNNAKVTLQNTVSVTVKYQWMPELYLAGPLTLQSTAVMPISY
jgi:Flp pilus assembly protein TadG